MEERDRYLVTYDQEAVWEIRQVKGASDQKALRTAVGKLAERGPDVGPATMKLLKGAPGLFELRPGAGDSPFRLLVARRGSHFVILALAHKKNFGRGLAKAQIRLRKYGNGVIK